MAGRKPSPEAAARAVVRGRVQGVGFREATVRRAHRSGAWGWVRNEADGTVRVHVEGLQDAVEGLLAFLGEGPPGAAVESVESESTKVEGHEQFAVRGVSAGAFVIREHDARPRHFELRLEVGTGIRSWVLPREPSMDPATRRLAIEVPEPRFDGGAGDAGESRAWDRGDYEQGGRVPWPEALDRGHAVFVLRGERLKGGFALQRTRGGEEPQWLMIKRRDEWARPAGN